MTEAVEKVCEVCGQLALVAIGDIIEGEPGQRFRIWEPYGPAHYYCADHRRKPIQYRREMPSFDELAFLVGSDTEVKLISEMGAVDA